jgi:voltage-gated potassium channel
VPGKHSGHPRPAAIAEVFGAQVPVSRATFLTGLVRSVGIVALSVLVYAVLPVTSEATATAVFVTAALGLVGVFWVFARQVGRISRAQQPTVAATEALALVFGLFATSFAFIYVSLAQLDPHAFSQPIDKLAGIYFSVTVLTSVGFGDIVAVSSAARALVTLHMVLSVILVGVAVKILFGTARRAAAGVR